MYFRDIILSESLKDEYANEFKENENLLKLLYNEFSKLFTPSILRIVKPNLNSSGDVQSEIKIDFSSDQFNKDFSKEKYPEYYKKAEEDYKVEIKLGYMTVTPIEIMGDVIKDFMPKLNSKLGIVKKSHDNDNDEMKNFPNSHFSIPSYFNNSITIITKPKAKPRLDAIDASQFKALDRRIKEITAYITNSLLPDWKQSLCKNDDAWTTHFKYDGTDKTIDKIYPLFYIPIDTISKFKIDKYKRYNPNKPEVSEFIRNQKTFLNKVSKYLEKKGFLVKEPEVKNDLLYSLHANCIEGNYKCIDVSIEFKDRFLEFSIYLDIEITILQ